MSAPALSWLDAARLQRIDVPEAGLLALTLYGDRQRLVLLARFDGTGTAGLVAERPRGAPASGLAQKLRKRLSGSKITRGYWLGTNTERPRGLCLELTGKAQARLVVLFGATEANVIVLDAGERAVIAHDTRRLGAVGGRLGKPWSPPPESPAPAFEDTHEGWMHAGQQLLESEQLAGRAQRAGQHLERALRRGAQRLERRARAIQTDLDRAERAAALREDAEWLLCHLDRAAPGNSRIVLPPREPGGEPVTLQLDPALSALDNTERWFRQARRFERGRGIGQERLAQTQRELAELEAMRRELDEPGVDLQALAERINRAIGSPGRTQQGAGAGPRRSKGGERLPHRTFEAEGDRLVLVGRSAADNDVLTLRHARPHDLWLHIRDASGSHVVVPLERGQSCPDRLRLDAALLAAHFSRLKHDDPVDVIYVERRYVRKRKGSPAGTVQLEREKVLRLRRDEGRLRWLLSRERS